MIFSFSVNILLLILQIPIGITLLVQDSPVQIEVIEESPIGTLIHGVAEYLTQLKVDQPDIRFQLLGDDHLSRLVELHPTTGQLRVAARIDRESLCPLGGLLSTPTFAVSKPSFTASSIECTRLLNVLITQTRSASSDAVTPTTRVRLQLLIRDINDHVPSWPRQSILEINFVETPGSDLGWSSMGNRQGHAMSPFDETASRNAKTIDRAVDPDMGMNGTMMYRLIGAGAEYFRLDDSSSSSSSSGNVRSDLGQSNYIGSNGYGAAIYNQNAPSVNVPLSPIRIWPVVPLDRETDEFAGRAGRFNLTLVANDLGVPPKTGSIQVIIHVTDVNDHAPQFHNDLYTSGSPSIGIGGSLDKQSLVIYRPQHGNIRETVPVGGLIVQLNATDKDSGLHAKVVYDFCPCDRNMAWNYFTIDPQSGRISVAKRLDYDRGPRQFQFKVIAKDSTPEPYTLTGTAIVEVTLTDENDETPEISVLLVDPSGSTQPISALSPGARGSMDQSSHASGAGDGSRMLSEYTTSLRENPQPETVVAYIQIIDRDYDGQDQVHCRLGPTDNFTLQIDSIDNSKYAMLHSNSLSSSNMPQTVGSGGGVGSTLHRQDFRLVTGTGMTNFHSPSIRELDREVTPTQLVTLTCTDSVGNTASVRIHVELRDVNDHAPEFVQDGRFTFQLSENQELIGGKPVWLGRTVATDKDQGENARITYRIEEDEAWYEMNKQYFDGHIDRLFELNSRTGDLYAKTMFDRETAPMQGVYRLKIYASDAGEPSLTGTALVEVYVLDVNDWAPQFTKDVYTFGVAENARVQEVIGSVEAKDPDADSQGKITYRLVNHSERQIRNKRDIKLESTRADQDSTNNNETNENGNLNSGDDTTHNAQEKQKKENSPVPRQTRNNHPSANRDRSAFSGQAPSHGQPSVQTNDDAKAMRYANAQSFPPSSYFSVDRLSGKIRLIRRLDRESIAFFSLEVVAVDAPPRTILPVSRAGHPPLNATGYGSQKKTRSQTISLSTTTTVMIAVTDVNDNAPIFRRPKTSTTVQLRLDETLGKQLLVVEALDADEGENARVSYRVRSEVPRPPGGPGSGYFAVDENSGILFLAKSLNTTLTHRLVIEACDNGDAETNRCTLSPSIQITVFDGVLSHMNDADLYRSRGDGSGHASDQHLLPFDLDQLAARSAAAAAQANRRNEVVVVCLVAIFSVLLIATIFLVACLVHRRGTRGWPHLIGRRPMDGQKTLGGSGGVVGGRRSIDRSPRGHASPPPRSNNGEPWIEEAMHQEQTEMMLDPKLDPCTGTPYDVNGLINESKYLFRENLLTPGGLYPVQTAAYSPVNFSAASPTLHMVRPMDPGRARRQAWHNTFGDAQGARMLPAFQSNADPNQVLTQSSYSPPSPDYQCLDTMWQRFPNGTDLGRNHPTNQRIRRVHNPLTGTQDPACYTLAQRTMTEANGESAHRFYNGPTITDAPITSSHASDPNGAHTYFEITEPWHSPKQTQMGVDRGDREMLESLKSTNNNNNNHHFTGPVSKSFNRSATLGRPTSGKGSKRRQQHQQQHNQRDCQQELQNDSLSHAKAGDLALHAGSRMAMDSWKSDGKPELEDTRLEPMYNAKSQPTACKTYQACREGTFV